MEKKNVVIYWIATGLMSVGMLGSGLAQIAHAKEMVDLVVPLGYPLYILYIIGVWKILGVITILVPGFKILKEWAYAGLLFDLSDATYSIIASGQPAANWIFMVLPIGLGVCSYIFYHKKRKAGLATTKIQLSDESNYYQNGKIKIADAKIA